MPRPGAAKTDSATSAPDIAASVAIIQWRIKAMLDHPPKGGKFRGKVTRGTTRLIRGLLYPAPAAGGGIGVVYRHCAYNP
jgi:hypothetical protein